MNTLERAIELMGGVGKLADALDVRQNVVSNWRARGLPKPWEAVLQLKYPETATNGAVTRQDLRADAHRIWPDLSPQTQTEGV